MATKIYNCDYRNTFLILPNGKNVRFSDRCSNRNGSVYSTNDEDEQRYIEECKLFKSGIIRLDTVIDNGSKAKDVNDNTLVYSDIKTVQDAIVVTKTLCAKRDVEYKDIKTKADVLAYAKKLNIKFPNL